MSSGGELVVQALRVAGVEAVFGVLSVHNIPIYDAIDRDGGIRAVAARSEAGALIMADGYARATGRLGVAITSTGVGAANTAGALVEATTGGAPVLHLTGQVDSAYVAKDRAVLHQAKDQLGILKSAGKDAFRAASTEELPRTLTRAMTLALTGRPGPVSVEIPIDQQYRSVDTPAASFASPAPAAPETAHIKQASELLRAAKKPLIWAGGGVISAGAASQLTELAERLGAGVITTAAGRGAIPEGHPQCLGNFGVDAALADLIAASDLLLAVGTRFRSNETRNWQLGLPPIVLIDLEPSSNYAPQLTIQADAKLALSALLAVAPAEGGDGDWRAEVRGARDAARANMRQTLGPHEHIMDGLRAALPRDAIVVRDVTVPATSWGARLLEIYEARTEIHSATLSIGLGLSMAIGAAVGRPDRHVLLLAGDGGFAISLGELATAVQERLNITTVLFNDGGYGILRTLQQTYFDGRRFAVDLKAPNWTQLARAFDVWSADIASVAEFGPALEQALAQPGPSLLVLDMDAIGPMAVPFTGVARLIPARA